jgi:hypothetical protein
MTKAHQYDHQYIRGDVEARIANARNGIAGAVHQAVLALRAGYPANEMRKSIAAAQAALAVEEALLAGIAADEALEPEREARRQAEAAAAAAVEAERQAAHKAKVKAMSVAQILASGRGES